MLQRIADLYGNGDGAGGGGVPYFYGNSALIFPQFFNSEVALIQELVG